MRHIVKLAAIGTVVLGLSLGAGCSNRPNPKQNASKALEEANIKDVNLDWDSDARLLHLKGSVDNDAERTRAEEVASQAVGTTGRVVNELTVKGSESAAESNDREIRDALDKKIEADPGLKERDIVFDVNNGVVSAKGIVSSEAEKNKVAELAKATPGVRDFTNALEVMPKHQGKAAKQAPIPK